MNDKEITNALLNILKKELGAASELLPKNLLIDIAEKISPNIDKLIESNGFVKKAKYDSMLKLARELEERIEKLEKA